MLFKIGKMHTSECPFKDSKDIYISQAVADVHLQIKKESLLSKSLVSMKAKTEVNTSDIGSMIGICLG